MKGKPEKVHINDRSIETAGLPNDYKEAVSEFIWNAFDAKASVVSIDFDIKNPIGNILSFSLSDNGVGIDSDNLKNTFGAFLDSEKRDNSFQRSSYTHGRKGKGRFSFEAFAGSATWETVYDKGELYEYSITISNDSKDHYLPSERRVAKGKATGTKVTFNSVHSISAAELGSAELENFLKREFGWFLHLNKNNDFKILINNKRLVYEDIIADSESISFDLKDSKDKSHTFTVNYVRWAGKIGDKFFFYYLNSKKYEVGKDLTSFNNKGDEFYHSIYIESDYFDDFIWADAKKKEIVALLGRSQSDKAFRELSKELEKLLTKKRKEFIRNNSERIIDRFESEGVMPSFKDNKYDEARKDDFEEVVREIYSVEPRIFMDLGKEQKQTFLGLLNLVLDTEERTNVMQIIDSVVKLDSEERATLANVLRKTTLSRITRTMKLIEQRYETVESLRTLVFDLKKFTTERDHIQEIIEENYWLFGEQYNLVSADQTFENALSEYLYIVDGKDGEKEKYKMSHAQRTRRPDIFLCRKRLADDQRDENSRIEENVIVELKTPTVTLGTKEYRQVEDYLRIVTAEDRFNGATRKWKFFIVSNKLSPDIDELHKAFKDRGKRHLVHVVEKYEIYAMTWDDLFRSFEIRHQFITDKLEFDKQAIHEELQLQGIELSKESAHDLTAKILYK